MNRDRFARLREILARATELPKEERAAYLQDACGDDTELRREAEAILAREGDGPSFLGTDATVEERSESSGAGAGNRPLHVGPKQIGPYRILEKLGEGGFGEVFAAEQSKPVRRRVAFKILKAGMDTREVLARFEAERQALAMMDHPNVCRVLDAGETSHGRPYFVMELLHGEPIIEYCDHHRLTMEERLDLFVQVCHAIQHAHQKGVIHRDVKPSNVLVTLVDGKPVPKVIDFGIAKATAQMLTDRTLYTLRGQMIGTPAYMSPEQAEMSGLDVDTRTDVYSLGVLLYELLTGRLPFETKTLQEAGLDAMRRIIREEEPPKPSTRVSTLGEEAKAAAARRRTDPSHWRKALRRELDWIVMKTLEKDRNRRYETVSGMAADVARYLADEPVLAGPPSAAYRLRKYVKRHRVAVGFAGIVAVGITLAFVLVTLQNARIAAARDEAEAVTTTLEEMLASVDPTKSGRDVTVREILDQTVKTLGEKFEKQPLVEARLRHTVGKTYYELGEYAAAEEHLKRAVGILHEELGDDVRTIGPMRSLFWPYIRQGRYEDAESLARKTLEISRRVLGDEDAGTLSAMHDLGVSYGMQDRADEAEVIYRTALETARRVLGEEHPTTMGILHALGVWSLKFGSVEEAEAILEETLAVERRVYGNEEPQRPLFTMANLANVYGEQGKYEQATALARETLEIRRRLLGEEHSMTLVSMWSLSRWLMELRQFEESETLLREALAIQRRILGDSHPQTSNTIYWLSRLYLLQDRLDEAESLARECLEISRRAHGGAHEKTNERRYILACAIAGQARRGEAISMLQDALGSGYRQPEMSILDDPHLASLHGDPEFEAIVEELRRRNEEAEAAAETAESE